MAMRSTCARLMVNPYGFIPGRPSVRGHLYRPSYINSYTRLRMVHVCQRSESEEKVFRMVQWPDQYGFAYLVFPFMGFLCFVNMYIHPIGFAASRERTMLGAMNQSERWKRNSDLSQLFDEHKDMIKEMRTHAGPRPKILAPPEDDFAPWVDTHGDKVE